MELKRSIFLVACIFLFVLSSEQVFAVEPIFPPIIVEADAPVRVQVSFSIPQDKKYSISPADIAHTQGSDERSFWFYSTQISVKFTLDLTLTYRVKTNQTITYSVFSANRKPVEGGIPVFKDVVLLRFVITTYEKEHYPTPLEVSKEVVSSMLDIVDKLTKTVESGNEYQRTTTMNMMIVTLFAVVLSLIGVSGFLVTRSRLTTLELQSQTSSNLIPALFGDQQRQMPGIFPMLQSQQAQLLTQLQEINKKISLKGA